jgi:hypothetical protein
LPDFPGNRKINTCRPANKQVEMNRNGERNPRSLLQDNLQFQQSLKRRKRHDFS